LIDPVPVSELVGVNQTVGVLRCTDEDGDDVMISLSSVGASSSDFALMPYGNLTRVMYASGAEVRKSLVVRTLDGFDFESLSVYDVSLSTADPRWPTEPVARAHKVTLDVNDGSSPGIFVVDLPMRDANEEPSVSAVLNIVPEDAERGTVVGTVVVTDPDAGDEHTVQAVVAGYDSLFSFNAETQEIVLEGELDYEREQSYSLSISATDIGSLVGQTTVEMAVTNVNDITIDDVQGDLPLSTDGTSAIEIIGTNLGYFDVTNNPAIRVSFGPPGDEERFEARDCTVITANTQLRCASTDEGFGANLRVRVQVGEDIRVSGSDITVSFAPPVLSSTVMTAPLPGVGGGKFTLRGSGFGPIGAVGPSNALAALQIVYAPSWDASGYMYTGRGCTVTVAHTEAECTTGEGFGASNWVMLEVADAGVAIGSRSTNAQTLRSASLDDAIRFAAPKVTDLQTPS